jgi:hypothetical protein
MRKLTQIDSGHLTTTVEHTRDKGAVKLITKSEQAYISMPENDKNPSRICCFSKTQNCTIKLVTKVFNCIQSLNEVHKYACVSGTAL